MKTKNLSDQARHDAFCRDLALALRRITGRDVDVDSSRLPQQTNPKPPRLPSAENAQ